MKEGRKEKAEDGRCSYDFENDVFFVRPHKRDYSSSVQVDDFILDLNSKGNFAGIEILNASKYFNQPKSFLKNIVKGTISVETVGDKLIINIRFVALIRNGTHSSASVFEKFRPDNVNDSYMSLAVAQ